MVSNQVSAKNTCGGLMQGEVCTELDVKLVRTWVKGRTRVPRLTPVPLFSCR